MDPPENTRHKTHGGYGSKPWHTLKMAGENAGSMDVDSHFYMVRIGSLTHL